MFQNSPTGVPTTFAVVVIALAAGLIWVREWFQANDSNVLFVRWRHPVRWAIIIILGIGVAMLIELNIESVGIVNGDSNFLKACGLVAAMIATLWYPASSMEIWFTDMFKHTGVRRLPLPYTISNYGWHVFRVLLVCLLIDIAVSILLLVWDIPVYQVDRQNQLFLFLRNGGVLLPFAYVTELRLMTHRRTI